ncbi:MAG TPA: short chain dehydrogenase, partial [Alcanivorax sp.]|nr:short chain dehydrogenase [Alcanivorax sp.]
TGAGRGLGRGIAEALASRGARIACVDLNEDDLRDTVARCERAGGEAKSYLANVAREDEVTALFDGVVADFGA